MISIQTSSQALIKNPQHIAWRFFLAALFITMTALAFSPVASANNGTLTASIDRNNIGEEETLQLIVRYNEQVGFGGPDFNLLNADFEILNNNQSNQYRSINGKAESFTQWKLTLAPKRAGKLLIPSFSYQGNFSDAIEIQVNTGSNNPKGALKEIFLETEISKNSAMVQEQLLFTVRLFTSVNLRSINSEDPELNNAITLQLAEQRYQSRIQGKVYAVVEVTYALFPQTSGELIIPSLTYQVTTSSRARDPWDPFGSSSGELKRLRTREQLIRVQPQAPDYNGKHWLPAKNLELQQDWSADPRSFKVGEPITRILTLKAEELTAAQLPPLSFPAVVGIKYYPDQPQNKDQNTNTGVIGIRTETLAIVPTQSGELTLPAVTMNWWDTTEQRQRQASLPATTITVAPSLTSVNSAPARLPSPEKRSDTISEEAQTTVTTTDNSIWITLSAVFMLSTLGLVIYSYRLRKKLQKSMTLADANKTERAAPEPGQEKEAFQHLQKLCNGDDLTAIRQAYLNWARLYWGNSNLSSIQSTLSRIDDPKLKDVLASLDTALFGNNQIAITWDKEKLITLLKQQRQSKKTLKEKSSSLRELYPA